MLTKYDQDVDVEILVNNLNRIVNQIYSLLPKREEGVDWIKPLETLIIELSGMASLLSAQEDLFSLVCKLEGLRKGADDVDFLLFRRTIFEACSLASKVKNECLSKH